MQGSGLDNRIIVVIGTLLVLSGGILLTDWQALPSDHCTEYSPFHHPELMEKYTAEFMNVPFLRYHDTDTQQPSLQITDSENKYDNEIQADVCFPRFYTAVSMFNSSTTHLGCSQVESCVSCITKGVTTTFQTSSVPCFTLAYNEDKLHVIENSYVPLVHMPTAIYECRIKISDNCVCVLTDKPLDSTTSPNLQGMVQSAVNIQSLKILHENIYNAAVNKCESLHSRYGCHWIPLSSITGKLCMDCPRICRSVYHTLTFIQFCIGAVLMKVSLATTRVSAVNLLMDVVERDIQVGKTYGYLRHSFIS